MDIEQQVGYLVAKIEEQGDDIKKLMGRVDAMDRLLAEKLNTVETVFKVIKFAGIVIVAVLTFKFGDIAKWWTFLFK